MSIKLKRKYPTDTSLNLKEEAPLEHLFINEAVETYQMILVLAGECNRAVTSYPYAGGTYGVRYSLRAKNWVTTLDHAGCFCGLFANYESSRLAATILNREGVELPRLVGRRKASNG